MGFLIGVFICGCCVVHSPRQHINADLSIKKNEIDIYKSVVRLKINSFDNSMFFVASGFAIDNESIITVGHFCALAVEGPLLGKLNEDVEMTYLNNNQELSKVGGLKIKAIDLDFDLCLLKKKTHGIIPVKIINDYKKEINVGEEVQVIGAPLGWFPVDTKGKVIAPNSVNKYKKLNNRLLISAPCAEGNSGSPVFNSKIEVIGVVIAKAQKYSHLTVATPSWILKRFLKESGQ